MSLHRRRIGMMPEQYSENIYRQHNIQLECGVRVNPIVFLNVSYYTICDGVIAGVEESGWYNRILMQFVT